jgi:hypothetical protein
MMKKTLMGIGLIFFAMLIQMCAAGWEWLSLPIGFIGLIITVVFAMKSE